MPDQQWSNRVDDLLEMHTEKIGQLERRVDVHNEKHRATDEWLKDMAGDVKAIRSKFDGAAGGWRLAAALGIPAAVIAAVGAGLHWFFSGGR